MNTRESKDALATCLWPIEKLPAIIRHALAIVLLLLVVGLIQFLAPEQKPWPLKSKPTWQLLGALLLIVGYLGTACLLLYKHTRTRARFGVFWDGRDEPVCACGCPLRIGGEAFHCPKCEATFALHDEQGMRLSPQNAIAKIRGTKPPFRY